MKSTMFSNICGIVFIVGYIFEIYIEISKKRKNNNGKRKNKSQEVNNDHLL